jgi:hypothetical protein
MTEDRFRSLVSHVIIGIPRTTTVFLTHWKGTIKAIRGCTIGSIAGWDMSHPRRNPWYKVDPVHSNLTRHGPKVDKSRSESSRTTYSRLRQAPGVWLTCQVPEEDFQLEGYVQESDLTNLTAFPFAMVLRQSDCCCPSKGSAEPGAK